jgi:hypothetical protein
VEIKEHTLLNEQDMEVQDIQEQAEQVGKLSPREYAKLRDMKPQLVYYYIRTGAIKEEHCVCGRKVIDVLAADEALQAKKSERRGNVDTRSDAERDQG